MEALLEAEQKTESYLVEKRDIWTVGQRNTISLSLSLSLSVCVCVCVCLRLIKQAVFLSSYFHLSS